MKWMEERDLLIAQTMAFVQSVTGKRPDAEAMRLAPQTAAPQAVVLVTGTETQEAPTQAVAPMPLPVPTVFEVPPAAAPAPPAPLAVTEAATVTASATQVQMPHFARLDIDGDFGSEVRARVANFRANQQRFLREREEYCTSTMAKVRAAIRDNSELPRSGK
ncbi:hypothetical protein MTX26_14170 [Bradyrhizobium sp. ISRA443]|uniref:hypothetical protein n=1 Tax=unclassified Bradyrhizobium TaxID=2631580 RepID=UPI0024797F71|nr:MULTISPECIES: hypothetical protein [unclassified Bradyrhizobium]WGR91584.1 hypothetical protein MTX20_24685 [Bradyrhizobium sp. ISRA435]WGS01888.1 hypothetical protein MTX23_14180 [Bradyrhizobium sp. ISRA436]WGS08774.1 hypothetical protein MTX18_14170 [Bradyrhizobium sp. ISRA437]WGS15662.1 hypothetical protein MTX26_14170 [Bradyrhizobium sp. ISRA443]